MNELVSVIIPNYNYAHYVCDAVDSVLRQDYNQIEIIVVDDGSTDNSVEILKKYGSQIKLIQCRNSGAPTARNVGLAHSIGSYIAYLDADDYWHPSKISKQIAIMESSTYSLVYCQMKILNTKDEVIGLTKEIASGNFRREFINNPTRTPFIPSTVLMSRELITHAGFWDTTFKSPSEDFDYFRRCSKFTDFAVLKEQLVFHRDHPASLTARSLEKYFADNRLAVIKLFSDEYSNLSYWEIKRCWVKLNYSYFKAFAKHKKYFTSMYCLLSCILPILYTPRRVTQS